MIGGGQTISVSKCSQDSKSVQSFFGDSSGNSFCGKLMQQDDQSLKNMSHESSLSKLFKDAWNSSVTNGNSISQSDGKATCTKGSSGGVLTQPDSGEYLGYCPRGRAVDVESISGLFIEKSTSSGSSVNLKLCSGNCFKDQSQNQGQIKTLTNKDGIGSEILFVKNT